MELELPEIPKNIHNCSINGEYSCKEIIYDSGYKKLCIVHDVELEEFKLFEVNFCPFCGYEEKK